MGDALTTNLNGKRVAIVTNIPRPYRIPLWEELGRRMSDAGGHFRVFFFSDPKKHIRRQGSAVPEGSYDRAWVPGIDLNLGYERVVSIPLRLLPALFRYRADVVIPGTFGPAAYISWLYTLLSRASYVQWSGTTGSSSRNLGRLAAFTQPFLARRAKVCLGYGTVAADFLVAMGARREKVISGVNAVDAAFFMEQSARARGDAEQLKAERGLSGVNILCVGNLVPLKGVQYVLDALTQLPAESRDYHLHLVGAGPAEAELRARSEAPGISGRVHFWGAKPPAEMPLFYALADLFVFPSLYDVWGLVLNEAMACGLPVVASPLAGATRDLVEDGVNGIVVDPRDTPALAGALGRLIADPELRTRMGGAASATIRQKATIQHSADAFMRAIRMALR